MKRILKEDITQQQIDNMQEMIDMSVKVLEEIEEQSRKQVLVTIGSSFRNFIVYAVNYYSDNLIKNEKE